MAIFRAWARAVICGLCAVLLAAAGLIWTDEALWNALHRRLLRRPPPVLCQMRAEMRPPPDYFERALTTGSLRLEYDLEVRSPQHAEPTPAAIEISAGPVLITICASEARLIDDRPRNCWRVEVRTDPVTDVRTMVHFAPDGALHSIPVALTCTPMIHPDTDAPALAVERVECATISLTVPERHPAGALCVIGARQFSAPSTDAATDVFRISAVRINGASVMPEMVVARVDAPLQVCRQEACWALRLGQEVSFSG